MTMRTRVSELAPPVAFGIPPKFTDWREGQPDAILDITDSPLRFVVIAAPTGFGKSLAYVGAAAAQGARTCILTSTKGLQTQLIRDFGGMLPGVSFDMGLVDVRGQNNYQCIEAPRWDLPVYTMCAEGPCHSGVKCDRKGNGCLYFDAYRRASNPTTQVVVTNYAYWLNMADKQGPASDDDNVAGGLGSFDMLILDEAHNALDELAGFLGVEIEDKDTLSLLGEGTLSGGPDQAQWREWATYLLEKAKEKADWLTHAIQSQGNRPERKHVREAYEIKQLARKLSRVAGMRGEWVSERIDDQYRRWRGWKWDPLFPAAYAERYLFRGVEKVCLISATCRPKTAEMMGIEEDRMAFNEYPSSFAVEQRPVYHVPTVQLNHRTDETGMRLWLNRIDQIIGARTDRKGIVHTVSYARAKLVLENSANRAIMVGHNSQNARTIVESFKREPRPKVLVSPSVGTGYDFPYAECEYQIIGKIPFPDNRSVVVKARMTSDKEYSNYVAMQQLVQAAGRGMRAEDDQCETLIIDDNARWFIPQNKKFAPKWFMDSYKPVRTLPAPLPKLGV